MEKSRSAQFKSYIKTLTSQVNPHFLAEDTILMSETVEAAIDAAFHLRDEALNKASAFDGVIIKDVINTNSKNNRKVIDIKNTED